MATGEFYWCKECKTKALLSEDGIELGHMNKCSKFLKQGAKRGNLSEKRRDNAGVSRRTQTHPELPYDETRGRNARA